MQKQMPKGYLFLHNISKKNNIGNIIRSACAFGFEKVLYISNKPETKKMKVLKEFNFFGNQGTFKQIDFQGFSSLHQAKKYLLENQIKVCGVEIGEGSVPIQNHPFTGNTAFFLGNEGTGILPMHREICDFFVYIPQYTEKTASLNVSVAAGIIFHHFSLWAGYKEAKVYGQKFQFQEKTQIKENNQIQSQEKEQIEVEELQIKSQDKNNGENPNSEQKN